MGRSTIKYVTDYVDYVLEQYPWLEKSDIVKILNYGFRVWMDRVIWGTCVQVGRYSDAIKIDYFKDTPSTLNKYIARAKRYQYIRKRTEWDGYYYFAYSKQKFEELDKDKLNRHLFLEFKNVRLLKCPDECYYKHRCCTHFFRVKYPLDCGWAIWKDTFRTKNYEYLGAWRNEGTALTASRKDETPISAQSPLQTTS